MTPRRKSDDERRNTFIKIATNGNNTMNEIKRHRFVFKSVLSGSRRRYRNSRPSMRSLACSRGLSVTSSASSGAPPVASRCARCSVCSSVGNRVQQKTGGTVSRIQSQWHKQVRSKVFVTSLLIVTLHCVFWLPYNLLNSLRYIDEQFYSKV